MSKSIEEHNNFGIDATIIADSKNEFGQRLTTYVVTFPRYILAEVNTHRVFSRNSASSRAVPFKTMVERVKEHPFIPIAWQKDHKGMQGTEYYTAPHEIEVLKNQWRIGRNRAVQTAIHLSEKGTTKQLCNRLLEPFMWHTAIITSTEWENFFKLRCPQYEMKPEVEGEEVQYFRSKKDYVGHMTYLPSGDLDWFKINKGQGEIHIMALAEAMWDAMNESKPKQLKAGEWHIPFGDNISNGKLRDYFYTEKNNQDPSYNDFQEAKIKIATARCARISYLNFEGKDDYNADIKLHDNLLAPPFHASPFEHCGRAMSGEELNSSIIHSLSSSENSFTNHYGVDVEESIGWSGNFRGFNQYRKMIE